MENISHLAWNRDPVAPSPYFRFVHTGIRCLRTFYVLLAGDSYPDCVHHLSTIPLHDVPTVSRSADDETTVHVPGASQR